MPADLPDDLRRFIAEHLGSIVQLELLLLLAADAGKPWSAEEAAKALYVSPEATLGFLEQMRTQGLCQVESGDPMRYRFAPARPEHEQLTRDLAAVYKERRLTIINLIYASPVQKFQSFADAFRLRKNQ
jgi:predicted ArsR family transcriptional regulator